MHHYLPTSHPSPRPTVCVPAVLLLIVLSMLGAACGSDNGTDVPDVSDVVADSAEAPAADADASDNTAETATPTTEAPEPTPTPEAAAVPTKAPEPAESSAADAAGQAPAGETLDWIVALLNDPDPDAAEVEARFGPGFLAQVPIEQVLALLPQISLEATGPWSVTTSDIGEYSATAVINAEGATGLNVDLNVDAVAPHQIQGLLFSPVIDVAPVGSVDEYDAALAAAAPMARVGVFEIVDGECQTLLDRDAESVMPVGSIFKLWILAELAHQIDSGEAAWDEVFPVQDRFKASPDGTIFNMAEGTDVTLREYAEQMISISDNSATDHLLHRLGRERVEAAMAPSGVGDPSLNIPFLSAAELFMIKFHPDQPNAADYRTLDVAGKRDLLEQLKDAVVPWTDSPDSFPMENSDGVDISQPRDHDLEWFASPADLCRTHAYLATLAATPGLEPIAEVLSINPTAGLDFDPATWADLRYKGGSEQGIVAVAWWMQRVDGRVFVLAGGVEDPAAPLDTVNAAATLHQAVSLIDRLT